MLYSEFKATVQDLHTGGEIPDSIDNIAKLVLGKLARLRLKNRVKIASLTVGSNVSFNLKTLVPDFFALKTDAENKNRCLYYYQSTEPSFFEHTNNSRFVMNTQGYFSTLTGLTLKINFPQGITNIDTLYMPYFSKYLVLDEDGTTEKEKPENDNDEFLFDSVFDDAFVEGVLLYLKRRELDDNEYTKATQEWNKSLQSIVFYQ